MSANNPQSSGATRFARATAFFSNRAVFALIALFAIGYTSVLVLFLSEGRPTMTVRGVSLAATPIQAEIHSVDTVRETITLGLKPDIASTLIASRGRLTTDVNVEIVTGASILTHTFRQGEVPLPWLATLPFEDGDPLEYPFDTYRGGFVIKAWRKGAEASAAALDLDKIVHGFQFAAQAEPTDDTSGLSVTYRIGRSPEVLFLVVISMASLLLVALSTVNVAWQVAMRGRSAELSMMTWITGFLFVVPTIRRSLPGGPPPGAIIDVALIIWLLVLTAGALLTVVYVWTRQK